MSASVPPLDISVGDAPTLHALRDELLVVYEEVYASQLADPFFSSARYWDRLEAYAKRDGFSLATGRLNDELVGYALGYTLPAGSGWWRGLRDEVDPELLVEDGQRTFAVNEIMVREAWRRRGYARALHGALLAGRPERRATLLVLPDNIPATTAYVAWGWRKIGEIRPFDDAPVYSSMILELPREKSIEHATER